MNLQFFRLHNSYEQEQAALAWNAACGENFSVSSRFLAYNTQPTTGCSQEGRWAVVNGSLAGFVLASAVIPDHSHQLGWLDAIAVLPAFQRRGVGSALLSWAISWLKEQGCTLCRLGGSLRPFAPGFPTELAGRSFFEKAGFQFNPKQPYEWDMARDLQDYPQAISPHSFLDAHPVQSSEIDALFEFSELEFPGRWDFEIREFLRDGGSSTDLIALWSSEGIIGFCSTTYEDSLRPIDRYFPIRLPRPWGQLGMIGIAQNSRGKGYGTFMIDAALKILQGNGVRGCIIDWTTKTGFYAKFGFTLYNQYISFFKSL